MIALIYRFSISVLLGAILASIGAVALGYGVAGVDTSLRRLHAAGEVEAASQVSRHLLEASLGVTREIKHIEAALDGLAPADGEIDGALSHLRGTLDVKVRSALTLLAASRTETVIAAARDLRAALDGVDVLRPEIDRALHRDPVTRDPDLSARTTLAVDAFLAAVDAVSAALDGEIAALDPGLDQYLGLKTDIWTASWRLAALDGLIEQQLAVAVGRQHGVNLRPLLVEAGRVEQAWSRVVAAAAGTHLAPSVRLAVERVGRISFGDLARGERNALIDAVIAGRAAGLDRVTTQLRHEARTAYVVDLARLTLDQMVDRAEQVAAEARRAVVLSVASLVTTLVLVLAGIVVFRGRVQRPLARMVETLRGLVAEDGGVAIPPYRRGDEITAATETLKAYQAALADSRLFREQQDAMTIAQFRLMADVQRAIEGQAEVLDAEVREKTREIAAREREIVWRLTRATDKRDNETGDHIVRMAQISALIAETMGLSDREVETIELAAAMHDIGKVAIPDEILRKPGAYTPEERKVMETHTTVGWTILAGSKSALIQTAADIAHCHHERYDGSGYPRGLAGAAIPLPARIAAVADVFDALTSERPYKSAWTAEAARDHIVAQAGSAFDPDCVDALVARWGEIKMIVGARYGDSVAA